MVYARVYIRVYIMVYTRLYTRVYTRVYPAVHTYIYIYIYIKWGKIRAHPAAPSSHQRMAEVSLSDSNSPAASVSDSDAAMADSNSPTASESTLDASADVELSDSNSPTREDPCLLLIQEPGHPSLYPPRSEDYKGKCCPMVGEPPVPAQELLPHQKEVLAAMRADANRFLVDHPTGSEKTRTIICSMDAFFDDARPKIMVVSNNRISNNLLDEMMRWPSRYRDYFSQQEPLSGLIACGGRPWKEVRDFEWRLGLLPPEVLADIRGKLRSALDGKWFYRNGVRVRQGDLPAPLRVMTYSYAERWASLTKLEDQFTRS
jgi:hypothetical protein